MSFPLHSTVSPVRSHDFYKVKKFLSGEGPDHRGRTLAVILAQDNTWLEETHDFIQWLFPLATMSFYNSFAPVLSRDQLAQLGNELETRAGLLSAYERMLQFLVLETTAEGVIQEIAREVWCQPLAWMRHPAHNDLRISRIISCLQQAGLLQEAQALLSFLEANFADLDIKAESLHFWRKAANNDSSSKGGAV